MISLPRPVPRKDSSTTTFSMMAYGDADRVMLGSRSSRSWDDRAVEFEHEEVQGGGP